MNNILNNVWKIQFKFYSKSKIKDFHEEHAVQAFRKFDPKNNGHILTSNFKTILLQLKSHLLSPYVRDNLETVKLILNFKISAFKLKFSNSY